MLGRWQFDIVEGYLRAPSGASPKIALNKKWIAAVLKKPDTAKSVPVKNRISGFFEQLREGRTV